MPGPNPSLTAAQRQPAAAGRGIGLPLRRYGVRRPVRCPGLKPPGSQGKPAEAGWGPIGVQRQVIGSHQPACARAKAAGLILGKPTKGAVMATSRRVPFGLPPGTTSPAPSVGFALSARRLSPRARTERWDPCATPLRVVVLSRLQPAFLVSPGLEPRARAAVREPFCHPSPGMDHDARILTPPIPGTGRSVGSFAPPACGHTPRRQSPHTPSQTAIGRHKDRTHARLPRVVCPRTACAWDQNGQRLICWAQAWSGWVRR